MKMSSLTLDNVRMTTGMDLNSWSFLISSTRLLRVTTFEEKCDPELQAYQEFSANKLAPLFPGIRFYTIRKERIDQHTIANIFRRGVEQLGLPPEQYGWRSLRSGCITWLIQEGVHPTRVMEHSGHRSLSVMLTYLRSVTSVASSPLAETRWCR